MRDVDQSDCPLGERVPEEICGAVLGDDPVDVAARNRHRLSRLEVELDRGGALRRARSEADNGHSSGRGERAAMKRRAGRDPAVQPPVQSLGADLAREIDAEGLRDRDHPLVRGDHLRIADVVDRMEGKAGVVVHQGVEPARAHRPARDDGTADHSRREQVGERLGDDVGVNRQVVSVRQMGEHLVRDPS